MSLTHKHIPFKLPVLIRVSCALSYCRRFCRVVTRLTGSCSRTDVASASVALPLEGAKDQNTDAAALS